MKVFLSSVISGFEPFRAAAAHGIEMLGHTVVRSQDFPAASHSPQVACLNGIRDSDAVVFVLGQRYGPVQRSGLSATHEEFREAKATKPTFVLVQSGVVPEPPQAEFIREAREWQAGGVAPSFADPETLTKLVVRALHTHELARATGPVDEAEMVERARRLVPVERGWSGASGIALIVVAGPYQAVLRPAELEHPNLRTTLTRELLFGPAALFDPAFGTAARIEDDRLVVEQEQAGSSFTLGADGSLVLVRGLRSARARPSARSSRRMSARISNAPCGSRVPSSITSIQRTASRTSCQRPRCPVRRPAPGGRGPKTLRARTP